jgi:hypothetical protein
MKPFQANGRSYTQFWAWFPIRTTKGQLLWFCRYYIRPQHNGEGIVLSHWDMLIDGLGEH